MSEWPVYLSISSDWPTRDRELATHLTVGREESDVTFVLLLKCDHSLAYRNLTL